MRVNIDQERCVAAGLCSLAVPDVFDQREEDGVVVLLHDAPADSLRGEVEEAAAVCPARAILLG